MCRLVFPFLFGLVLVPLPLHAQSVTLTVCNMGKVDIDVFVSGTGKHIRPATCAAVAQSAGAMEPAYVGLAFTDARGQWGAARRFNGVPYMGVKNFPVAIRLAMSLRREKPPEVLTLATRSETVRRGNVSLPMQLLFQPGVPECRAVPTGGGATIGRTTIVEVTNICEDLGYTLKVEAYPDSREIRLGSLHTSGFFSDGPLRTVRISEKTVVDWAEEEAARKAREAPEPVNWSDLLPTLRRYGRRELRELLPAHIVIRGTVSRVDVNPGIDNTQVVNVVFRESPVVPASQNDTWEPYAEFNACTISPDIFQDVFGADFRTSMIGKSIEVRGEPWGGGCRGLRGGIGITLARQMRPAPSAQFAAGTRFWVPPPVVVPPPRPAPTNAEIEASIHSRAIGVAAYAELAAKGRLSNACVEQAAKASAANPGNWEATNKESRACQAAINTEARRESQKAQACAEQVLRADPTNPDGSSRDFEGLQRALLACSQAPAPGQAAAPAPKPAAARATAPAPTTTSSDK